MPIQHWRLQVFFFKATVMTKQTGQQQKIQNSHD